MIIIGYQGIGKSTMAGQNGCIDLESGNFWANGKRAEDWYIPYCQIANHLSEQGYTVFVSSHEVVRNELKKSKERVVAIVPAVELRDEWTKKLFMRYMDSNLEKDYKAYANAKDRYTENIMEIINSGFPVFLIYDMDYDLKKIVNIVSRDISEMSDDRYYDTLTVEYEEFTNEGVVALTASRGDESLFMVQGDAAKELYMLLCDDTRKED
jgi:hypothetical protein